ncbi:MAG: hypothetical protein LBD75_05440 [Candidatus Peribacteria bacterium]|jgi:cysteine-rich repeat protein|nr:hypothetical protein [Candidatus Peribacteria bacterium]
MPNTPPTCGNGTADPGETCENCPQDLTSTTTPTLLTCSTTCGNGEIDSSLGEECDNGALNGKDGLCSSICKLETCGNGIPDLGETCQTCPQDLDRCIIEQNCNTCPCQYADFASDLRENDQIRAKLRDQGRKIFYRFSPVVAVSDFLYLL